MSTQLQTMPQSYLPTDPSLPMTPEDLTAQVRLIQRVMEAVMKDGEHYGLIPGCGKKPSLLKAGAEKLCLTFRLDPQYDSTERYDGTHLTIKSKCILYHNVTGRRLGSGEGSCSTRESKYAYREGKRICPRCGKDAIIKGKQEYGGGWLCFVKREGCGAKWPDGAAEIESQSMDRVPNEDLPDQYNTILKMANKRSLIAAVLNVTAASDIFSQDLEDLPAASLPDQQALPPTQPAPPHTNGNGDPKPAAPPASKGAQVLDRLKKPNATAQTMASNPPPAQPAPSLPPESYDAEWLSQVIDCEDFLRGTLQGTNTLRSIRSGFKLMDGTYPLVPEHQREYLVMLEQSVKRFEKH